MNVIVGLRAQHSAFRHIVRLDIICLLDQFSPSGSIKSRFDGDFI